MSITQSKPTPHQATPPDRKGFALWGTLVVCLVCGLGAMGISEWPLAVRAAARAAPASATAQKRAAFALRDHVNAFQKWGTQLFVQPTLKRGYDRVFYFTQASYNDQKQAFLAAMRRALHTHDAVDLFLYIHNSWRYLYWIRAGIRPALRRKLRLVYNTGCGDLRQGPQWLAIGADAYVGHPGRLSISPIFAVYFARRWIVGVPLRQAVEEANALTRPRLLLAARLSFGFLDGPTLWRSTQASLLGDPKLQLRTLTP